jgi:hypothetical protein
LLSAERIGGGAGARQASGANFKLRHYPTLETYVDPCP